MVAIIDGGGGHINTGGGVRWWCGHVVTSMTEVVVASLMQAVG